ncbi:MAG: thioether cross-link-forming SCIFF peptide maturase [Firmicutes bacterium]|nr:thioether cross-link-forming SCIFF peptide maturase [Bacillota bacterium]
MSLGEIHKFRFDDLRLVLDVNSGAVHAVDEVVWDLLSGDGAAPEAAARWSGKYPVEEIATALEEIDTLRREGLLFSEPALMDAALPFREAPVLKSLCLHVAHDCNLRCRYCFADTGPFGGLRGLMPLEVARKAIDMLLVASGARRQCEVDFFGGEPLLNFAVVQETVRYGRERAAAMGKELKFTLTTNATMLEGKVARFLLDNDINVVLSLDGRPAINDRMRFFADGTGSYNRIMPRIKAFVEEFNSRNRGRTYCYVRGTFTRENLDFAEDVRHLADAGFTEISMEPVVATGDAGYAIREEDLRVIEAEYDRLAGLYLQRRAEGNPFKFFHFNLNLEKATCLSKRISGCGAGHEYLAVAPDGTLYPCHQFMGREGYAMGNVFDGEIDPGLRRKFREAQVLNKPGCAGCWARLYCSGGCHANAQLFSGDIYEPYEIGCRLQKKRLECALGIQARIALEDQGWEESKAI